MNATFFADPAHQHRGFDGYRLVSPCKTVLNGLPKIYDDASLSDVTFRVGKQEQEIHAHRIILSMVSTEFRNMFTSKHDARWHEKVIHFPDDDAKAFATAIQYLYGREIILSGIGAAFALLQIAHVYAIVELIDGCTGYLLSKVAPGCCCAMWNNSQKLECSPVMTRCMAEMTTNFEAVAMHDDFLELEEDGLAELFKRDDLVVTEEKIFEALMYWVRAKRDMRQGGALDRLLPLVRLPLIDNLYLQDYVDGNELLRGSRVATKLLAEAYKYQASPAHRRAALRMRQQIIPGPAANLTSFGRQLQAIGSTLDMPAATAAPSLQKSYRSQEPVGTTSTYPVYHHQHLQQPEILLQHPATTSKPAMPAMPPPRKLTEVQQALGAAPLHFTASQPATQPAKNAPAEFRPAIIDNITYKRPDWSAVADIRGPLSATDTIVQKSRASQNTPVPESQQHLAVDYDKESLHSVPFGGSAIQPAQPHDDLPPPPPPPPPPEDPPSPPPSWEETVPQAETYQPVLGSLLPPPPPNGSATHWSQKLRTMSRERAVEREVANFKRVGQESGYVATGHFSHQ